MSVGLRHDEVLARSLAVLDAMDINDCATVGLCNVPADAPDEEGILRQTHGSESFLELLTSLGRLKPLFGMQRGSGGLDTTSRSDDGTTHVV